ncbi:hypothetical protein [Burkholderia lata]|uniref:hypothetical protein n=1 Tax=Burkholderia lata (strain ATCC 17760 / DSM 23089 / LMG 22485 / NCIMB 9086 / R18194 / 383) TaxID=482957 RepID=UPI001582DC8D|nr:hypothetical protein [Burkholderia lata]
MLLRAFRLMQHFAALGAIPAVIVERIRTVAGGAISAPFDYGTQTSPTLFQHYRTIREH